MRMLFDERASDCRLQIIHSITRYRLTPVGNSTKLMLESNLIPSNWFYRIVVKLTGWASKYVFDEQYGNFITYVYEQENRVDDI